MNAHPQTAAREGAGFLRNWRRSIYRTKNRAARHKVAALLRLIDLENLVERGEALEQTAARARTVTGKHV